MKKVFDEIGVSTDTYITDAQNNELTTKQVSTGYWLLGFDRDGSCFEMSEVSRDYARVALQLDECENGLDDLDITDFDNARYYWNENAHDLGVLKITG